MESQVLEVALSQGIWAVLAVFLLIYIVKTNERYATRQEERENKYQQLLSELTDKFSILNNIENDIAEVKDILVKENKYDNKT